MKCIWKQLINQRTLEELLQLSLYIISGINTVGLHLFLKYLYKYIILNVLTTGFHQISQLTLLQEVEL
jgi:hypothetical protein